uniref:Uncharacterized protein n=1 Tax=Hyaloperonospora arabidopsidis (strain Emoy2) TaxID=559515 RepID=M4BTY1_HYAAE
MGACFPMALPSHQMGLVVLMDETLNINHQLGERLPTYVRRWIFAPANEVVRSLFLHVTVVQDTLHVKALTAVRVHQQLWWRWEDHFGLVCRKRNRRQIVLVEISMNCVIGSIKRGRIDSLRRLRYSCTASISRMTDRSSRSRTWRTSGRVRPFVTMWRKLVARWRQFRLRLRI